MATRPKLYTLDDVNLCDCPNCEGTGIVTPEEVDHFRRMQLLAQSPSSTRLLEGILVGMILGVAFGVVATLLVQSFIR